MSKFGKMFFENLLKRIEESSPQEIQEKFLKAESSFQKYSEMLESLNANDDYTVLNIGARSLRFSSATLPASFSFKSFEEESGCLMAMAA